MIAYIDTAPEIEPHHGAFLVTFTSGGESIKVMLTLHALKHMEVRCNKATAQAFTSNREREPIPFRKPAGP